MRKFVKNWWIWQYLDRRNSLYVNERGMASCLKIKMFDYERI
ncbi:MAG TPA: hypothetical protein PLY38_03005 [Candidatus Hydrothermia bacterium]|nr:hypothetical protein [Defluviitaleaceae bacterium]HRD22801.1 hypothetical protein [Candidatus Hydrothermia bacterium]